LGGGGTLSDQHTVYSTVESQVHLLLMCVV